MSNSEKKNKICKLNIEKASNNLQRFKVSLSQGGLDHRNAFDITGKRICIWHHIVNGVLVERQLDTDINNWSPYFFLEKQAKMSCIIGRIFRTNFDPTIDGDHFNVGTESQNPTEDLHICVSLDNKEVIVDENGIKRPNFGPSEEKLLANAPWTKEAGFIIHGEAGGSEIRFSFLAKNAIEGGIPYLPVWYFYTQGASSDPIVSLDPSPVINWPSLRAHYEANKQSLAQGEGLGAALRDAGFHIMLRFHVAYSNTREADVGQSKPGGPPPSGGN